MFPERTSCNPLSRREMLLRTACGFGAFAFRGLNPGNGQEGRVQSHPGGSAKRVLFLYMDGGVSQVDSFDPKPKLDAEHGRPIPLEVPRTQFDDVGTILKSPWAFQRGGESGIPVSDLFPNIRDRVDDLAVIRSMTSKFPEHTFANYFLHTGTGFQGRPSMGAWWSYGLGSENQNLPGYIVLDGGLIPPGGLDCFGSGFLPAQNQATVLQSSGSLIPNIQPLDSDDLQNRKLQVVRSLDGLGMVSGSRVEASIANQEKAFRMQAALPEVADISGESDTVKKMYGLESDFEPERIYGTQCLLARRLLEKGVRFVQLTCPAIGGLDRWDQHTGLKDGHERNARAVDRPIAALLDDLKGTGLWEDTLVVWTGEFGRTPMAQGNDGRDHNPHGFSMWMAGAGVKKGVVVGETDEYGYFVVDKPFEIHDLHATMLHLMGVDHKKLTYRFDSRDMRLTDVHGHVIKEVLES